MNPFNANYIVIEIVPFLHSVSLMEWFLLAQSLADFNAAAVTSRQTDSGECGMRFSVFYRHYFPCHKIRKQKRHQRVWKFFDALKWIEDIFVDAANSKV